MRRIFWLLSALLIWSDIATIGFFFKQHSNYLVIGIDLASFLRKKVHQLFLQSCDHE